MKEASHRRLHFILFHLHEIILISTSHVHEIYKNRKILRDRKEISGCQWGGEFEEEGRMTANGYRVSFGE